MAGRRWAIWVGVPVAVVAIGLALNRLQPGAEAGGRVTPPPAGTCAESPIPRAAGGKPNRAAGAGSWWRLDDRLDDQGSIVGRRLAVGRDGTIGLLVDLSVESAASGPIAGIVVATMDDGQRSGIRLVSAVDRCSWELATSANVVRGAILDPADGSVIAHLVDRATRADLGTWRFTADPLAEPVRIAPALPVDAVGPVWVTDLRLDTAGRRLAIQSCGEEQCQTRIFDLGLPAKGPSVLAGQQGALIGWAGTRLVTWSRCSMLPCGIVSWDAIAGGDPEPVHSRADAAAVTPDGRFVLASTNARQGRTLRIELATGTKQLVLGVAEGEIPLMGGTNAVSGLQLGPDEVAIGAPGANPRPFRPSAAEVMP